MKIQFINFPNGKQHGPMAMITALLVVIFSGCTKNFEKYNTNSNLLTNQQTLIFIPSAIGPIEQNIFANYQIAQNLSSDEYSGYMMTPHNFGNGITDFSYAFNDGWNQHGFDDQYTQVMSPINKIAAAGARTKTPEVWAVCLLIQVVAMDRVVDKFGPIPYTKAGTSLISTPYDDVPVVYQTFFKQIDTAVTDIQAYLSANSNSKTSVLSGGGDLIYNGDMNEWLKFANSLRLRLAMHIVKKDPTTAQQQGETALKAQGGLLTTATDDAAVAQSSGRQNDLYVVTGPYGDNGANAAITSYMVGYNDPRLPAYFSPATYAPINGQYVGIRIGLTLNNRTDYQPYALPNLNTFNVNAPQLLMTAAEVWFLKAEAALRGWANAGTIQTDYETGITTSMEQWGVSAGSYVTDATSVPAAYTDPRNAANDSPALSSITIKWDPAATQEKMLERITTQKWLAVYPDGAEGWAIYRRTGYPALFPVVNNFSGGTVSTSIQVRRLPYPSTQYSTNASAVATAVSTLLNGPDNGGTRVWWDVDKPNF